MYAVIFRAEIKELDHQYGEMASQMRKLAINQYSCAEFISVTEDNHEISISYWQDLDQIKKWKQDARHLIAQNLGIAKWYKSYKVEIVEILRSYKSDS